ncbi:MAG: GDP-mannose dehydrogenase [Alphaproteobacteria bacterium]|nr:GDP-mannose dehydrogenase [Alphaproteobacteria bacterium]
MTSYTLGVAGLTHLGLVQAGTFAAKRFRVVAFDPDGAHVDAVKAGRLGLHEPGLADLLADRSGLLDWTADPAELAQADVVFLTCDVPVSATGDSDLSAVKTLLETVVPALSASALLVIQSQVPPGFTRGIDFAKERLFYQVETLVFGEAVSRAAKPPVLIVGKADPTGDVPPAYEAVLSAFDCPRFEMGYESAELAKISINAVLAASLGMANTLADLSEAVGASWLEIEPVLRSDPRIGPKAYVKAGLGIGGGNIGRDLTTIRKMASASGTDARVVAAISENSARARDWLFRRVRAALDLLPEDAGIAVLGLAYKPGTASTLNAPGIRLLDMVAAGRHPILVHDPEADFEGRPGVTRVSEMQEAVAASRIVVIATAWQDYAALVPSMLPCDGCAVIDPFGILDGDTFADHGHFYARLGSSEKGMHDVE